MTKMFLATLITVVLSASIVSAATLTVTYKDGSSQNVRLKQSSSEISQINIGDGGYSSSHAGKITVVAGSYGMNCRAQYGNKTDHIARQCNGKSSCDYKINYQTIGDPAVGCGKEYIAEWHCGDGEIKSVKAGAEAGFGSIIKLRCQ